MALITRRARAGPRTVDDHHRRSRAHPARDRRRWLDLDTQITTHDKALTTLAAQAAPDLAATFAVGPGSQPTPQPLDGNMNHPGPDGGSTYWTPTPAGGFLGSIELLLSRLAGRPCSVRAAGSSLNECTPDRVASSSSTSTQPAVSGP